MQFDYSSQFLAERRRPLPWMFITGAALMAIGIFIPATEQWIFRPTGLGVGLIVVGIISGLQYRHYRRRPYLSIENGQLIKHTWPVRRARLSQIKKTKRHRNSLIVVFSKWPLKIDLGALDVQSQRELWATLKSKGSAINASI